MRKVALVALLAWPVVELVTLVLVADQVGWGPALLGLLLLSALGFFVLRTTTRRGRELGRVAQVSSTTVGLGKRTADLGFRFVAGLLLLVPGYVSGAAGLLLLIPPVRAVARAATGNAMVRRYPTMYATVTRVRIMQPAGDVVPGEVIRDDPGASGSAPGETDEPGPPALPPAR